MKTYRKILRILNISFWFTYILLLSCLILLLFILPHQQTTDVYSLIGFYVFIILCMCFIIISHIRLNRTYRITTQCIKEQSISQQQALDDIINTMRKTKTNFQFYDQGVIIRQGIQFIVIPFQELIWAHPATTSTYYGMSAGGVTMDTTFKESYLYVYSRRGIIGKCKLQNYTAIYQHLQEACPNAIIGYDKQYRKYYKKQRNDFIQLCKEYDQAEYILDDSLS